MSQKKTKSLQKLLDTAKDIDTKKWFENYLKHEIKFRGLKTPLVTKIVKDWINEETISSDELLEVTKILFQSKYAEDKYAGSIIINLKLLHQENYQEIISQCSQALEAGHFYEWSSTDWLCVRVLSPIVQSSKKCAKEISSWHKSENLWKRRASIVSFKDSAKKSDQYHPVISKIAQKLIKEQERFIQTGIGWTMCEASKNYPEYSENFFRSNLKYCSLEIITRHAKFLPCHQELKNLKKALI